jgi:hypothetical protein
MIDITRKGNKHDQKHEGRWQQRFGTQEMAMTMIRSTKRGVHIRKNNEHDQEHKGGR